MQHKERDEHISMVTFYQKTDGKRFECRSRFLDNLFAKEAPKEDMIKFI